ncbi:DUF1501 domain-containing protein [Wenzhouxiangella marina]|uniref:Uncharacterized protein n=1 Tax=Wenzhouxiangella marina TaxID=1579979 RepID=A0A0K0XS18_9GAMM|nr:DUF1501 domain-containing protein [Wenzhouxiangella marina]AKS40450.1 hypothetical protein WM2015_59 [Wenzhouxiangella marina]MBB6088228.1 uncharacterized protein (DUF1501 family) [Wenzhouxiangella marina]
MNRRELLKWMAISGAAASAPGWVWAMDASEGSHPERLIVLFLRGGADGLSLCAPLGDSAYFDRRPALAIREADGLPLDAFFALHPSAGSLKTLYDAQELGVVHAAGLFTAERSHFEAQAVMEQGIDSLDAAPGEGWLGRYLASLNGGTPLQAVALDKAVPLSMAGLGSALALGAIDDFSLALDARTRLALADLYRLDPLLDPTAQAVFDAAGALGPVQALPIGADYPPSPLGTALADAARLIKSGSGLKAAAINTGGWDTHESQNDEIAGLIAGLGDALLAFRNDLGEEWARTTVVVQTEFGRRVAENASAGTDHGHGGVMFLAGGTVNGGQVHGDWPGLHDSALSDGQDLTVTTDYRQVFAELLATRFGVTDFAPIFNGWQPGPWQGLFLPAGEAAALPALGAPARLAVPTEAWTPPASLDLGGLSLDRLAAVRSIRSESVR